MIPTPADATPRPSVEALLHHTPRLTMRPWRVDDLARWAEALRGPEGESPWEFPPRPEHARTEDDFAELVLQHHALIDGAQGYPLVLFTREEPVRKIGFCVLFRIKRGKEQSANIGYGIDAAYRRQGYAAEAARGAIQVAFDVLKLHRVEAWVEPENVASRGVVERVGMRLEGISRRRIYEREAWRDVCMYATTAEEREVSGG